MALRTIHPVGLKAPEPPLSRSSSETPTSVELSDRSRAAAKVMFAGPVSTTKPSRVDCATSVALAAAFLFGAPVLVVAGVNWRAETCTGLPDHDLDVAHRSVSIALGLAAGAFILHAASLCGDARMRANRCSQLCLLVLGLTAVKFALEAADQEHVLCVRVAGGFSDTRRAQSPIRLLFWVATAPLTGERTPRNLSAEEAR
jgi:hypothetical protein